MKPLLLTALWYIVMIFGTDAVLQLLDAHAYTGFFVGGAIGIWGVVLFEHLKMRELRLKSFENYDVREYRVNPETFEVTGKPRS